MRKKTLSRINNFSFGEKILKYPIHFAILFLVAFFSLILVWILISDVDRIVVAQGITITSNPKYTLKPLNKSIIRNLNVKVGDVVKKGAVIVTLDPTTSNADVKKLSEKFESYFAKFKKLEAKLNNGELFIQDKNQNDWALQNRSLQSEKFNFDQKVNEFNKKISGSSSYLRELIEKQEILKNQVSVADETLHMWDELVNKHQFGSKTNYLKAQNDLLQLRGQLADNAAEQAKIRYERDALMAEKNVYISEWESKQFDDLVATQRDMREVQQDLIKAETDNRMVTLVAHEDAFILEIAEIAEGSIVTPNDTLVKMIPFDSKISVEVKVNARDISYVSVGQNVNLKLDALPYQRYGELKGRISSVTRDSFKENDSAGGSFNEDVNIKKFQNLSKDVYYIAHVDIIESKLRNYPDAFHVIPGLSLVADINVGKRPLREFLFFPLQKVINESLREP